MIIYVMNSDETMVRDIKRGDEVKVFELMKVLKFRGVLEFRKDGTRMSKFKLMEQ